jgi:hypothetical protein
VSPAAIPRLARSHGPWENPRLTLKRVILVLAGVGLLLASLLTTIDHRSPLPVRSVVAAAIHSSDHAAHRHRSFPFTSRGSSNGWYSASALSLHLDVYEHPDGSAPHHRISALNPWNQPIRFLVKRFSRDAAGAIWVHLMLGVVPNGSSGWVRGGQLRVVPDRDRIVVDMSTRVLQQFHDGHVVHRFVIAVGAPDTPTTPGVFFVWAKLSSPPTSAYGAYVLGLSGFSRVLTYWQGGGRIAIHGTDDPADRGQSVSHGCVRVYNPQMDQLRDVPMGTPVLINA